MSEQGGFGELTLGPIEGTAYRVKSASPRVRLAGRLVREGLGPDPEPGSRLVVHGLNEDGMHRIIYRIGEYHADGDWYEAEWPD